MTTSTLGSGVPDAAGAPSTAARRLVLRRILRPWPLGLGALTALTAFAYLWALQLGQRSEYYAAIALSMSQSWANLLFGSVDPAGTVSLDKIPGSYWVPALFVRLFGFSTWSVNAPNALATVAAVLLVAFTARRIARGFGLEGGATLAGLLAGSAVAATPILAAVARSNQPESFFVLALALAAWAATKAVERASARWLVGAGAFIALAFQMYMLEAWAVWPALAAGYLVTRKSWWRKIRDLAVAGAVSLVLSLTWIAVVALIPASSRPYVGGTYSNDPFEMVFGYNGLGRFSATADSSDYRSFTPPFSGEAGVLRLFNVEVAGQVAWLIPVALLAIVVLLILRMRLPVVVFLGGWLVTFLAMFSAVAGMHQFYTASLALPMGLLVGLAFAVARSQGILWAQLAMIGVAALTAVLVGLAYPGYLLWIVIVQGVLALVAGALLVVGARRGARARGWVSVIAGAALLLTPAAWSLDAMNHENSINPIAGAQSAMGGTGGGFAGMGGGFGGFPGGGGIGVLPGGAPGAGQAPAGGPAGSGGFSASDASGRDGGSRTGDGSSAGMGAAGAGRSGAEDAVLAYVQANRGSASYLLATFGAQSAASYITATDGDSVLPIGGFSGSDPAPTLDTFEQLVSSGQLRFVLMSSDGGFGGGFGGAGSTSSSSSSDSEVSAIREWVTQNCTAVDGITDLYSCSAG
ncbi:4-amino-4-deoxy-L-arabinose transferase [Humibacter sp. BT305]|nr:4-amino-4-deoxy-L-arabinose transferase [Humibacter sp. BT305]